MLTTAMDNSVDYVAPYQNYTARKFCRKGVMINRIFYITLIKGKAVVVDTF